MINDRYKYRERIKWTNERVSKGLSRYVKIVLDKKVRELAAFLSRVEVRLVFSYVKCFKQA